MKKEAIGITLHQLKIFWTVAQASSFTKASKILGLAQPSLSQQISKLEDENTLGIIKKTEKGFKTPPVRYKRKLN